MNSFARIVVVGLCGIMIGCVPQLPQRKVTIEAPKLSCEDANRLAYRAVTTLRYTITSLQVAREGQPGRIVVTKEGGQDGRVTITCAANGAVVEPERVALPIPTLAGGAERPHDFQNQFRHTFNVLRSMKDIATQQGPGRGLIMTMTPLNSFESQMNLGADLPAGGVLPIKVEINNNTPRPYEFDAGKVYLQSAGGSDRVVPLAPPAAGQGRALQGEIMIQPGQTVTGYLFYPAGKYSSARTTLIDKENDEGEGFSVQF